MADGLRPTLNLGSSCGIERTLEFTRFNSYCMSDHGLLVDEIRAGRIFD